MKHTEAILLTYRGDPVRTFALADRPLEVGRDPRCDIVIHAESVAERALLVRATGGTVMAYPLGEQRVGPRVLPRNQPLVLGGGHAIVRVDGEGTALHGERTERMDRLFEQRSFVLLVGSSQTARRLRIGDAPVLVGSSSDADLVLNDRAVSAAHCRFDPLAHGVRVRDLGSRNGTWVNGLRVETAEIAAGTTVRVGRTDVRVVASESCSHPRAAMVAASPAMLAVLAQVEMLARHPYPVLVEGETGVGKEGIARALHAASARNKGPWVALNAGGLSRELVTSELFGHEKGAFTGAHALHRGVFEQAHGGTLFLDEVGELPLDVQAQLLRVLETNEVRRVGGTQTVRVDVRLVCATHRDLRAMVHARTFREDLYYRIRRFPLHVPPLRERPEDVAPLAQHFLEDAASDVGERTLDEGAVPRLLAHVFPGNVRELRNVITFAAATCSGRVVLEEDVTRAMEQVSGGALPRMPPRSTLAVVRHHGGNVTAAAKSLGISRTTLRDRLRRAQRMTKDA